jgi:pimeloyl-ACP methyl ester carboxylesterase
MKNRTFLSLLALLVAFLVAGCSGGGGSDLPSGFTPSGPATWLCFDPSVADIPLPMDLARDPETGFNALPGEGEPQASINSLQGWSTSGPMILNFSALVDEASVHADSILLIDSVTNTPVPVTFRLQTLSPGKSTVLVSPVRPLVPSRSYLAIVTNRVSSGGKPITSSQVAEILKFQGSLVDAGGHSKVPGLTDEQAQALEKLRVPWQPVWAAAEAVTGQPRSDIPFAWTFTTQPLFQTLPILRQRMQAEEIIPVVTQSFVGADMVEAFFQSLGVAAVPHDAITAVYIGYILSPNYLADPLNGPFQGSPENPTRLGSVSVPFLATVGSNSATGTVIFAHGITRTKADVLALANSANAQGLGAISLDLVLHGDRKLPDQPSGTGFINLKNLRMSRDNIRQSVNDLYALSHMIASGNTDFNGDQTPEFSTDNQVFLGQSLGGIVGTVFVATEPNVRLADLNATGARVPRMMVDSVKLGPVIIEGLKEAGIELGTLPFEQFLWAAQTVVDDADPFNYANVLQTGSLKDGVTTAVLVQEMVDDLVIPNSATHDLVRSLGTKLVLRTDPAENRIPAGVEAEPGPVIGSGFFQYINGMHGFLLDPGQGPTVAAQTQVFTHFLTGIASGYTAPTILVPPGQRTDQPGWEFPFEASPEG